MKTARTLALLALTVLATVIGAGCRMDPPLDPSLATTQGVAECPVCRCEGDLACLIVKIGANTPSFEYQGRVWYFCSQGCCDEFQRRPEFYAQRATH